MKKRFSRPQIVAKLRQADVLIGQGKAVPEVCKVRRLHCRSKIVLNVALAATATILALPPWPRIFRLAS